ncbi:MAG TPA: AAA family ATPase, partial [Microlunatus sp.]|nr:AAA family ATPase [Microlunatus sp.]
AASRPAESYSLGMQQRLAIAGALLGEPDYLILDEPAIGLDPEGIRWLRGFLRSFAATGRVVLISSHLLKDAQEIVDDVVVIRDGRLIDRIDMARLSAAGGTTRLRVDDLGAARKALGDLAETLVCGDDEGQYLRVCSQDVTEIGFRLYRSDVIVYELVREELDLEQLFFSALEGAA